MIVVSENAAIAYVLPEGWSYTSLSSLPIQYGDGLTKQNRCGGEIPVFGSNGIVGWHNRAITRGPTIIIGRKGSVGEVHFSGVPCWPIDTTYFIDEFPGNLDQKYLYYFLKFQNLSNLDTSTTIPGINRNDLGKVLIPTPLVDEQHKIVAKLESILAQIRTAREALGRVPGLVKAFRQSVLAAAFRGELSERNPDDEPVEALLERIRAERRRKWEEGLRAKGKDPANYVYEEPAAPDVSNLPELPEGWVWTTTDSLFYFVTSGSRGWAKYYSKEGSIFLRMGNLDHDAIQLDLSDIQFVIPPNGTEGLRTLVQPNDILVSITADVGMIGLVPENLGEAYINQHVSLARPVSVINPKYLAWFLASPHAAKQFLDLQRGATKVGLGLEDITSVVVPLPPLEEQNRIVQGIELMYDQISATITAIKIASVQLSSLEQAAMAKAFRGDL